MATYKKRGYKTKTKEVLEDATEDVEILDGESTTAEVFDSLDAGASKAEEWVTDNQKGILGVISVVVLCVLGYMAYTRFYQEPRELEASNEIFQAEEYFNEAVSASAEAKDSLYNLALTGGKDKYGFLEIIENYGGTKTANLAKYYAGFSYLNTKKYQEAISQLEGFSSDDAMLGPLALGGIGDAFSQLGQLEEAVGYYDRAAKLQTNDFTTPRFLMKSALLYLEQGNGAKATASLERIKKEFPKTSEAGLVPAFLAKAQALN